MQKMRNIWTLQNNLILRNTRSSVIPRFCGIIRCFESGFFFGGGGLPYEECMRVCHVLGSYFQGKIPKMVFPIFHKNSGKGDNI